MCFWEKLSFSLVKKCNKRWKLLDSKHHFFYSNQFFRSESWGLDSYSTRTRHFHTRTRLVLEKSGLDTALVRIFCEYWQTTLNFDFDCLFYNSTKASLTEKKGKKKKWKVTRKRTKRYKSKPKISSKNFKLFSLCSKIVNICLKKSKSPKIAIILAKNRQKIASRRQYFLSPMRS